MPAQVVIVHEDREFAVGAVAAFEAQGSSVIHYDDALAAMDALAQASAIELLITCLDFGGGRSNGIALAYMVRLRKRSVRCIFIGPSDPLNQTDEVGMLLPTSATVADLLAAAQADNWSPDGTASESGL
jgi:DNA-binding response OmpR family regulator